MSFNANTNRHTHPASETILVANGDQALAAGTLASGVTNTINLQNGQLGAYCDVHGFGRSYREYLQAGDTVANAPSIRLVQGTPYSQSTNLVGKYGIKHKAWVETPSIDGRNVLAFSGRVATVPTRSAVVIGDVDANTTTAVNVANETLYTMHIGFNDRRQDKYYSVTGLEVMSPQFTTPNYTALGTVNTRDHLLQNLVFEINRESVAFDFQGSSRRGRRNVVAFGINIAGGGGGINLNAVAAGTAIPTLTSGGITYSYTADQTFVDTLTQVAANSTILSGTSQIYNIDLTTAGTALNVDAILLVAIDHEVALLKDRVPETKSRIFVGLEFGFSSTVSNDEVSYAFEGHGQGRKWQIRYEARAAMQHWSAQNHPVHRDFFIEAPSYLDENAFYSAYVLEETGSGISVNYSHTSRTPHRVVILIPGNATGGTADATTVASLNAILGPWIQSVSTAGRLESELGLGAAPNYFQ
jgi:hypothetical protein